MGESGVGGGAGARAGAEDIVLLSSSLIFP